MRFAKDLIMLDLIPKNDYFNYQSYDSQGSKIAKEVKFRSKFENITTRNCNFVRHIHSITHIYI